jgi:hypothetical protein
MTNWPIGSFMANEATSLTKATYDKRRPRKRAPSPARCQAELEERVRDAAKSRRLNKLSHTDRDGFLREIGLASRKPKPPQPLTHPRI